MIRVHVMDTRGNQLIDKRKLSVLNHKSFFKIAYCYFHVPSPYRMFWGQWGFVLW